MALLSNSSPVTTPDPIPWRRSERGACARITAPTFSTISGRVLPKPKPWCLMAVTYNHTPGKSNISKISH